MLLGDHLPRRLMEPIAPNSSADNDPSPSVSTSANLANLFSLIFTRSRDAFLSNLLRSWKAEGPKNLEKP